MLNFVGEIEGLLWYAISFTIISTSVGVLKSHRPKFESKNYERIINFEDKNWSEQNVNEHILGLVLIGEVDTGT